MTKQVCTPMPVDLEMTGKEFDSDPKGALDKIKCGGSIAIVDGGVHRSSIVIPGPTPPCTCKKRFVGAVCLDCDGYVDDVALRAENRRLLHKLNDLQQTAECAEDMRDKSDAEHDRLARALRTVMTLLDDADPNRNEGRAYGVARAALSESEANDG